MANMSQSLVGGYLEQCLGGIAIRRKKKDEDEDELGGRAGVQRDMTLAYQQPHLVAPMKLVFYDDIPSTPQTGNRASASSRLSQWASSSRDVAVRVSGRASQSFLRRVRTESILEEPFRRVNPPVRRLAPFRPLELSIYLPNNRLSNLPEFDLVEVNDIGEITLPPKAHTRAKSEAALVHLPSPSSPLPSALAMKPYKSMVGDSQTKYWRSSMEILGGFAQPGQERTAKRQSVVWTSFPGLPPQKVDNAATSVAAGSSSDSSAVTLIFPPVEREPPVMTTVARQPVKIINLEPPATPSSVRLATPNGRISQWLQRTGSSATASSRRSRKAPSKLSISAPIPILDRTATMSSIAISEPHSRTRTMSSSTVASTTLSSILLDAASVSTYTTMASTAVPASVDEMPPVPKPGAEIKKFESEPEREPEPKLSPEPFQTPQKGATSHWNYLPSQYAEVWKRETMVSEADVGVAF